MPPLGLRINIDKTEVMGVTKRSEPLPVNIYMEGRRFNQVASFKYLGSLVSEDGRCDKEIKARIGMAKANYGSMRKVLANMSLGIQLRLRILKSYVWSGLMYGCENWNISAEMQKRLEAAEMWLLRRMMRIPWTARRTNQEVLQMAGTSRMLITVIRQRQLRYLGHVLRSDTMEKDCLLGMIEGRRARGRQRNKYMDGVKALVGCREIGEVLRLAQDREQWSYIVANLNIEPATR